MAKKKAAPAVKCDPKKAAAKTLKKAAKAAVKKVAAVPVISIGEIIQLLALVIELIKTFKTSGKAIPNGYTIEGARTLAKLAKQGNADARIKLSEMRAVLQSRKPRIRNRGRLGRRGRSI